MKDAVEGILPKKTFETMNGLRGLAALIVVLWHGGTSWFGVLKLPGAYLAVDLFFVLSGFVIAYSYEKRFLEGMTTQKFFIVRMIRFYPLYIMGTAIACIQLIGAIFYHRSESIQDRILAVPFAIFMIPGPDFYPLNAPAWTLLTELIANLAYAASYKYWSIRNIIVMMMICGGLMLSADQLPNDIFAMRDYWGNAGSGWATLPFGLLRVFYSFPAGVLIYRIVFERNIRFPQVSALLIVLVLPLFLLWANGVLCKLSMLVGIPLLVAAAACSEPTGMMKSTFALLGSASYAIYALHVPLLNVTHGYIERSPRLNSHLHLMGFLFVVAIMLISLLVDKWYDIPVRRMLNRKFDGYRSAPVRSTTHVTTTSSPG